MSTDDEKTRAAAAAAGAPSDPLGDQPAEWCRSNVGEVVIDVSTPERVPARLVAVDGHHVVLADATGGERRRPMMSAQGALSLVAATDHERREFEAAERAERAPTP